MRGVRVLIAALLILVGAVWIGQGLNLIRGSGMSGQPFWAVVGAVLVLGGAALAWTTRRRALK